MIHFANTVVIVDVLILHLDKQTIIIFPIGVKGQCWDLFLNFFKHNK